MSTLTADQIINLWWTHEQIRKAFKTLGAFQDYQPNPSSSNYSVSLTHTGKISVVKKLTDPLTSLRPTQMSRRIS